MAQRKGISTGTSAQRSIEEAGKIRFNTSTSLLEYYDGSGWKSIDSAPTVSSVDVTEVDSGAGGNATFVITGSNFSTTITNSIATKLATADFNSTFDTRLSGKSTTNVSEGTNLYYTNARADARISNAVLSGELFLGL